MKTLPLFLLSVAVQAALCTGAFAAKPRARDLGVPFDGTPGAANAITDVAGVAVGYTTLIEGEGAHAVRTGVTAIVPRGNLTLSQPVFAGLFSLNGNGELTGSHWIDEGGTLDGPVLVTTTRTASASCATRSFNGASSKATQMRRVIGGRCPWSPKRGTASSMM